MNKVEALEVIKDAWQNRTMPLGEKVAVVSSAFSSAGLDLAGTASHINATPSELDALLQLGGFDDEVLQVLSEVNPPKSTWQVLANSNDEEIQYALASLKRRSEAPKNVSMGEYVYSVMAQMAGPTTEQKVNDFPGGTWKKIREKAEAYSALKDREIKFLKSIASWKAKGKDLTEKQLSWLVSILEELVDKGVLTHESLDGDQELCDAVLEAIGR